MDEELVRRAARGDADVFDALARDRIDRLFSIAIRILRDHHDAEDAVQQALWTAWSDLPGLRDPSRLDAWLYRLVVRASYRAAGRSTASVTVAPGPISTTFTITAVTPDRSDGTDRDPVHVDMTVTCPN
jgi:RNA polymerase sigma-70 factor (ECF subfamily)